MLVFGFVYVWLFVPETKGLSLEEVDEMYRSGVKPWHSAEWKPADKNLHPRGQAIEKASVGDRSIEKKDEVEMVERAESRSE